MTFVSESWVRSYANESGASQASQFTPLTASRTGWRDGRLTLRIALLLGLAVRLAVLWRTSDLGASIVDEQQYVRLAQSIVQGSGFAWGPGEPTSMRPPLYPGLVASIWSLSSSQAGAVTGPGEATLQTIRVVQILLAL